MARSPDPRAALVLAALAEDGGRPATFQGLRRRLGLHPQALARTLRALVGAGRIGKDGRQFRLAAAELPKLPVRATVPLVAAVLPPTASTEETVRRLEHRWFRTLHWYGRRAEGPATVLTWTTEAGRAVHLRVADHALRLEVEPGAERDVEVFAAARPLLATLAELYAPAPPLLVRA